MDEQKKRRRVLEKLIAGALRDTINSHGMITRECIGSAAKRMAGEVESKWILFPGKPEVVSCPVETMDWDRIRVGAL